MSGTPPGVLLNATSPPPAPAQAPWATRGQGHQVTGSTMFVAGIVLLGVIALGLAVFFYFVHKRQVRQVARMEAEREERRRRAEERRARQALEAEQRAASIPIKSVVPVFIMQPDGRLILAAHTVDTCGKDAGEDGLEGGAEPKPPAPEPAPVPRTRSLRRNVSFGWRRQAGRPSTDAEQPDGSAGAGQQPPPV